MATLRAEFLNGSPEWLSLSSPKQESAKARRHLPLVQQFLQEQQELTAVERFSQAHERVKEPSQSRYYEQLLPAAQPGPGQQYAFSVDLDQCTGCKGCVTACHSLNGLEEKETWRSVGLLHGGTTEQPVQQTVTTACHHCLEPACMKGCPVNAYEKDTTTGIVKHLDDQCIGCQYCTLTCPYEVPQYSKKLGIVRKCDMCSERLAVGEAPACVQACPNEAISIRVVDREQVLQDVQGDTFLPGAPSPGITLPTTEFKTARAFPKNTLPADFFNVRPAPNHWPLVVLLVFNQLSVGAIGIDYLSSYYFTNNTEVQRYHALGAVLLGLLALAVSVLHLGRPHLAFRAILGIGHSWMSREVAAVGAFAGLSVAYAATAWAPPALSYLGKGIPSEAVTKSLHDGLGAAVSLTGLITILCSTMLYAATRRVWWRASYCGPRFFLSALVQGFAVALLAATGGQAAGGAVDIGQLSLLRWGLVGSSVVKLSLEASVFTHLRRGQITDLKRTALLMRGELASRTQARFTLGVLGGILLPALLSSLLTHGELAKGSAAAALVIASLACIAVIVGELLERSLFFMAAASPRMPGAVGS